MAVMAVACLIAAANAMLRGARASLPDVPHKAGGCLVFVLTNAVGKLYHILTSLVSKIKCV